MAKTAQGGKSWSSSSLLELQHPHLRPCSVADHPRQKTCGIILTGGGNKCRTMKERLQQVTTRLFAQNVLPSDLEDAVARGALMRYPQNVADELPFGYFYLGQIQPLDWKLHQDICRSAIWKLDRRERKMKGVPQPGLISSYENGEYMTKHRLKPLVFRTKNGLGAEQSIQSFCVHMTFPVDLHYEYAIDLLIYFAETKQKDNSAAHDKLGRLRHGIKEPIREFVNVDIDWGYWQDRFTHYESEGSTWLDIEGIVEGEITDAGFRIHVTLLEPGEQVQMLPATGQPDAHADYRVLHQLTSEIWSPHRSHQISDNVTRKRVRPTRKRAIGKLPAHVPNKRPVGSTHLPTPATSDNQSSVEPDSTTVDRQASTQMRSSRASASAAVPGNHADDILNRTSPSSPRPSIIKEADHTLGCHARSAQSKTSPGPSRKRQRKATARTSSVCMECATAKRKCIATDTPGVGKCRHCDAQNFDCTHNNRPSSVRPCDRCAKHNRPCNARDETGNLRCFNCARRRNRCTFGRKGSPQREQFDTSRGQDLPQRAADALNLLEPFPSEEAPSGSNIVVARPKPGFKEIRWGIVNVLEEQSAPISSAEIRKILHSRLHMNVYAGDVLRVVQELENEGLLERRQDRSIKLRSIGGRAVVQEAIDAANELLSDDSCSI